MATPRDAEEELEEELDEDAGSSEGNSESEGPLQTVPSLFASPFRVFVCEALERTNAGFRPSATAAGYMAELVSTPEGGFVLRRLGEGQHLSFKYEPPSPKFSRKRPGALSYRLQLLQGSQFLYSLRGLPATLRCQRSARALEWGPIHVVFASGADLGTFLQTIRYVVVQEVEPPAPGARGGGGGGGTSSGGGAAQAQALLPAEAGLPWPAEAARLWMRDPQAAPVDTATAAATAAAGTSASGEAPAEWPWPLSVARRALSAEQLQALLGEPNGTFVTAAVVVAAAVVTAALIFARRSNGPRG